MKRGLIRVLIVLLLVVSATLSCRAQSATDPAALVGDNMPLHATIHGRHYALEAFVLRRVGTDKLPVALITHGALPGNPRAVGIGQLKGWADEMAQRGWLAVAVMRRGYGTSEGNTGVDGGGCASPDVGRYLDGQADDLQAALEAIARRPDADMSRVLGIGDSAGGAAMFALAARHQPPLAAVINISGGLAPRQLGPFRPDPACDAYTADMVWNFARFGSTAHMPTLWLYAENDAFFRPGLVNRMRAAFEGSGGKAELAMLPPFAADGHTMFYAAGGRSRLLPELDRFLRAHGLPTWNEQVFDPLMADMSPSDRLAVEHYLRDLPTEKALALGEKRGVFWREGRRSVEDARDGVLVYCREQVGGECHLAAVDFQPVPPTQPSPPAD